MRRFLRFLVSLLAILVLPLTYLVNIRRNKKCPPPANPILFKSATELAAMIRNRQVRGASMEIKFELNYFVTYSPNPTPTNIKKRNYNDD